MRRLSDERGQTALEYLGVLVMIAGLVGVLAAAAPGIGSLIEEGITAQVCKIADGRCGHIDVDGDGSPDAVLLDTDGDGVADAVDVNDDGVPDGAPLDTDSDGEFDAIDVDGDGEADGVDLDGDGSIDGVDVNGDGVPDGIVLDLNGDGAPDGIDVDGDGQPDGIDIDGDGIADVSSLDANGDGLSDAVDLDQDGNIDGTAVDLDGDGQPDSLLVRGEDGGFALLLDENDDGKFDGLDTDGDGRSDADLEKDGGGGIGGVLHGVLDGCGLVPVLGEPCDLVNAGWYALEGDWVNAGLSAGGAIPIAGWGATGAKWALKYGDDVAGLARHGGDAARLTPATRGALSAGDDVVVLGKYPDYIDVANRLGARRFDIPADIWNRMSDAERWTANQKFLDRAIARGAEIRLASSPLNPANMTGQFAQEIQYLLKQGYTISSDGLSMIPPGG